MTRKLRKHETGCLIAHGLDIFGDRWTLLILRDMLLHGKNTYSALAQSDEDIATNILANRLKLLEEEGIVTKSRDPDNGRSYLYKLTEKGAALAPVLLEIVRWSAKYVPVNAERARLVKTIEDDRDGFSERLQRKVLGLPT